MMQSGTAHAAGGRISFSGGLVNTSCQLSTAVTRAANGSIAGVVQASSCGNTPATFSSSTNIRNGQGPSDNGIALITLQAWNAGPVVDVRYH